MKHLQKILLTLFGVWLSALLSAQQVVISTANTTLVLSAPVGGEVEHLYYGSCLTPTDLDGLSSVQARHSAYPVYGLIYPQQTALAVTHNDGNMTLEMEVVNVDVSSDSSSTTTAIALRDKVYPFYVTLYYKAYSREDVIETWTEFSHQEKGSVTLRQFASGFLPIRRGDVWISHLSGYWANEAYVTQEPLTPGQKVIQNSDGVRNAQLSHSEVMFSLDGRPEENHGAVIGAALCYSGNYKLVVNTGHTEYHEFTAGINEENSAYSLKRGETFTTPVLALTYTDQGLSGASRNFHRWARSYVLAHGDKERKILLNSWEGVYMDITQEKMDQMMGDIASMGGELFVMDDGWFGTKYTRDTDKSSLGDWDVNPAKLPRGIQGLIDDANKHGIKFGIWIEPEMANTLSELYEKHPEWAVKAPERDLVLGRGGTQVVLDLSNPAVQDFVFGVVDNLMTTYPEIDYIKWDANMSIHNHGSQYLTADNQSHLFIEYHRGFERVCQRIREKYPDLTIQACSSGGARANYGVLRYFDEFWTSDNTDALQRVYMQWGTSYFFPSMAMGAHISASPNHQTFRSIPLKYRIDVAMSARLGMEMQPSQMTDEEKLLCKNAIEQYKRIRPIVQFGDIYRLLSPFDHKGAASLMYVTPSQDQAVFYWYKTEHYYNQHIPRVKMAGLDPVAHYRVSELNRIDSKPLSFEGKTFSGAYLMANGLEIPYNHVLPNSERTDFSSRVLLLERVE